MSQVETEQKPGVLLVDDEKNILLALERLLLDEEFPVYTATSGDRGLEVLRRGVDVGVIVSDQRMPGMSGARFLEQAREMVPRALRIMLTGYADISATIDAINKGGACRYITKPWQDHELLQVLREGLRSFSLQRENERLQGIIQAQNEELKEWNTRLKTRVLQQTSTISRQNRELHEKNEHLKEVYSGTLLAFSSLLEFGSAALKNHTRNVTDLSLRVARALQLPEEEVEKVHVGALLHDIGDIGCGERFAGRRIVELSEEDRRDYLQHAVRGQTAIDKIADLRPAGLLIRHHHEYLDGSGYPDGLVGEAIPLGARIIGMADFIDRAVRQSKAGNALAVTLDELKELLGTHYDPRLYPLFKEVTGEVYQPMPGQAGLRLRTLQPENLCEGMILQEDLYSGTGLLLLSRDSLLDEKSIEAIRRYQKLDPSDRAIAVLVKE